MPIKWYITPTYTKVLHFKFPKIYGKNHYNIVISLQLIKINGKINKYPKISGFGEQMEQ